MVALAEMNSDWIGDKIIITLIYFTFVSKGENGLVSNPWIHGKVERKMSYKFWINKDFLKYLTSRNNFEIAIWPLPSKIILMF